MQLQNESIKSRTYVRYLQVIAFIAVYISLGFFLHLKTQSYLLLGIPLTIFFQLLIAKQPLYKLWLRDEEKFHLNKTAWVITCCFLIFPVYQIIVFALQDKLTIVRLGYYTATMFGAIGAGYTFSRFTIQTLKDLLLCFVISLLIRGTVYFFPYIMGKNEFHPDYLQGIKSLLTYIPVAFVVEEVVFRGMLDTYIYPAQKPNSVCSALFISLLWGLWHTPLYPGSENTVWFIVLGRIIISIWGILLSVFWRRTGNLAVPVVAHAFADVLRDALK